MGESKLTGPVSPEEAAKIVERFIDGHFSNQGKEGPRITIPADPQRDDDIRLTAFVEQAKAAFEQRESLMDNYHKSLLTARPIDEWGERDGNVLWWKWPVVEPPYVGIPDDDDFPDYVTHWTPLVVPIRVLGSDEK